MAYCHQFPNLDTFNEKGKELLKYSICFMHSFQWISIHLFFHIEAFLTTSAFCHFFCHIHQLLSKHHTNMKKNNMKHFHLLSLKKPELDFSAFLCWWWIDLIFGQQQIEHSVSWCNWSGLIIQSPLLAIQYLFYTVAQIPNVEVTLFWINIYVKISCFGESHSVMLMQGQKPPFEAVNKNLLKSSLHLHIIAAEINLGETMALSCSRYCT